MHQQGFQCYARSPHLVVVRAGATRSALRRSGHLSQRRSPVSLGKLGVGEPRHAELAATASAMVEPTGIASGLVNPAELTGHR